MDLEAHSTSQRVYVKLFEPSETLTEAYLHPEVLQPAKDFVSTHLSDVVDSTSLAAMSTRQAIYLGNAFSAKIAIIWFGIALAMSIIVGIAAGYGAQDWNTGLAIGSILLAVLGPGADDFCMAS